MIPTEPTWRSYIAETTGPIFSPKQCQMVIDKGMSLKSEEAKVGMGQKPEPIYLRAGQKMRLGIEKLGVQTHNLVADV